LPNEQFKIACLSHVADTLKPIPPNLEIFTDAYGDAFEDLILGCKAVLLPLIDPNVMSGQIVCLRSMQAAKPIYITQNNFMIDWIREVDQLQFITIYQNLENLLELLGNIDKSTLDKNGINAREYFYNNFSEEQFYNRFVDEIVLNFFTTRINTIHQKNLN
jgi:glycosyltransferase involved in cell wall biosynthesis